MSEVAKIKKADSNSKSSQDEEFKEVDLSDNLSEEEVDQEVDLSHLRFGEESFKDALIKRFGINQVVPIKKLAYYISKSGLRLEEACLLTGFDYNKFKEYMEIDPLLKRLILIKQLEYKANVMKTISIKAFSGDYKIASWLMEKKYEEEYGDKKKVHSDDDLLAEAVAWVQENSSVDDMMDEGSSRNILKDTNEGVERSIHDFLK